MAHKLSRRRVLGLFAAGTATGFLAACGGAPAAPAPSNEAPAANNQAPATNNEAPAATEAPAAVSGPYQGKFVIMSVGNPEQNEPLIKGIQEAHPGVELEWRFMPSERYTELFTASEVAGDQIDMMDLNGQDLRRYALGGRMLDLSDLSYTDRFQQVGLDTYTINGKLWSLPRGGIGGFTFFYNKKVLEKIGVTKEPETYDDMLAMVPDLKSAGIAPFVHAGKNIYLWPIWQFWAHGQTSGNKSIERTMETLSGKAKFTDSDHVEALQILQRFSQDGMFIDSVNSLDGDGAWLPFTQGKAAFFYTHVGQIGTYRRGEFPELDMSLIAPVRAVQDSSVKRQMPGGTGNATGIYAKIAPERLEVAYSILDLMTSDTWVKWANELSKDPVSVNKNVQASDDEIALKYAKECSPNQVTYLDWNWPPEITRAFQENQQAIVAGTKNAEDAAQAIQQVMDDLYLDGYSFES
jgi:raffinose/stachyose/melibiose transport system substrate-binding protein